jgi:hypothetical protein
MEYYMFSLLAALAAGGCLIACPVPYERASDNKPTGFTDYEGAGKLVTVSFVGNGFTSPQVVEQYAIYRAAEVANAKGKPYFVMYRSLLDAARDVPSRHPCTGMAYASPVATSFILLLDEPRPGAQRTAEVLDQLKDVIATGRMPAP